MIVGFERICRDKRVVFILVLFRSFFAGYPLSGWYQFLPQTSRKLKSSLPSKNAKWKNSFAFFKIPSRVEIHVLWRPSRIGDEMSRFGFPKGYQSFHGDTVDGDLAEEAIPVGGEAPYAWSTMLVPEASSHLTSRLEAHRASQTATSRDGSIRDRLLKSPELLLLFMMQVLPWLLVNRQER